MPIQYSAGKQTKQQKAVELYENTQHLPKEAMIRVFIRELNLPSENSARTYISLSKKSLASKLNIIYKPRKRDHRKTIKGQTMELFNSNPQLTRKEMIKLFEDTLKISYNSAAVHCSQCAAEYTGPKHKAIA